MFPALTPLLQSYGAYALFGIVFFESIGFPLPGETSIIVAGGLVGSDRMTGFVLWFAAFAAAVLGDNLAYLIGRRGGRQLVIAYGSRIGITHERLAKAERIVERRGLPIVAAARFFPLLRQLNGLAAGTVAMRWPLFLAANVCGALAWTGVWFVLANRVASDHAWLHWSLRHSTLLGAIALSLTILCVAFLVIRRKRR